MASKKFWRESNIYRLVGLAVAMIAAIVSSVLTVINGSCEQMIAFQDQSWRPKSIGYLGLMIVAGLLLVLWPMIREKLPWGSKEPPQQ